MKQILQTLFRGESLTREGALTAMNLVLHGGASDDQIGAFLAALHLRGERVEELEGFLIALRQSALRLPTARTDLFDNCGTGGDNAGTFNISTAAALVMAGAGVAIAKHGNRSVSGRCGSADVLDALGVAIENSPIVAARTLENVGFAFLLAPFYHPGLTRLTNLRRSLAVPTVFNLLGPLANPARVTRQILGVFDVALLRKLAEVLRRLGTEEAMVVASDDGLDEFSLSAKTHVAHVKNGNIAVTSLTPEDFGLARASRESIRGGDVTINATILEGILTGKERGPRRDVAVMNAAAGLIVAGKALTLRDGVGLAQKVIDEGKAYRVLQTLRGQKLERVG